MFLIFTDGGSPDPRFNAQLSNVIEQAKRYNMPASNIKNVLEQSKVTFKSCNIHLAGLK